MAQSIAKRKAALFYSSNRLARTFKKRGLPLQLNRAIIRWGTVSDTHWGYDGSQ